MRKELRFNHLQMKVIISSGFVKGSLAKSLRKLYSRNLQVVLVTDNLLSDLFGKELLDSMVREKLEPMNIVLDAGEVRHHPEEVLKQLLNWLDTCTTVSSEDVLILGLGGSSLLTLLVGAYAILPRIDLFIRPRLWLGFIPTTPKATFVTTFIGHHTFYLHSKPISVRRYPDLAIIDPSLISSLPFSKLRTSMIYPYRIALILSKALYNMISDLALDKLIDEFGKVAKNSLDAQINYLIRHCFSKPEDYINLYRFFRVGSFLSYDLRDKLPSEERVIYSLLFELYLAHELNILNEARLKRFEKKIMEYSYMKVELDPDKIWQELLYRISPKIKENNYIGELTLIKDVAKPVYLDSIPVDTFKKALDRLSASLRFS